MDHSDAGRRHFRPRRLSRRRIHTAKIQSGPILTIRRVSIEAGTWSFLPLSSTVSGIKLTRTARGIRGIEDCNLGSDVMVGHKVGLSTAAEIPSDFLCRRDTFFNTINPERTNRTERYRLTPDGT